MSDDLKTRLCRGEWRALLDPELPLLLMMEPGAEWWCGYAGLFGWVEGAWVKCFVAMKHALPGGRQMFCLITGPLPYHYAYATRRVEFLMGRRRAPNMRAALAILRTYLPVSS